ncbi:MAG: condensation domain-containing protein [Actinomycetota bacterium]|nr:condensation domain-containing protein [Actinomycetota bacterium]
MRRRFAPGRPAGVLDEGIVHLDSTTEPWSVHLEVHLDGLLDGDRLRRAVEAALDRHPRARCRLAPLSGWPRRYEWQWRPVPDLDPVDIVDADSDEALARARAEFLSRPISLESSPPLRLRVARRHGGDVVMLNVHHAAGDGMAALVFLQSVARAYASRPEVVADGPRPMARSAGWPLRTALNELVEAVRPSVRMAPDGGHEVPGYGFHLLSLGTARTRALLESAVGGVTVNDLLLSALHLAVATWNRDHGTPAGRISVLMPVNLRTKAQWRAGFDNLTFMVPVSSAPSDRLHLDRLVGAVARRTREVKDRRSAAAVVTTLAPLQALPLFVRRWVTRHLAHEKMRPTTLLSNLGRLEHDFDFGPGVGRPGQVWFSPPARIPLGVAIGALTDGDQLRLTFRVRHPLLGPGAAARFALCYPATIDEVVAPRLNARVSASRPQAA